MPGAAIGSLPKAYIIFSLEHTECDMFTHTSRTLTKQELPRLGYKSVSIGEVNPHILPSLLNQYCDFR